MSIDRVIALYSDYHWEGELRALNRIADSVTSGVIVAIGSYRGQSDCALALHAHVPVYCIDPRVAPGTHYGDVDRPYWMRNVLDIGVAEKVRPVELPSLQVAKFWTHPIGLLFIDGDHDQAGEDLNAWMPHVIDGGIVAMHDSNFAPVILSVAGRTDLVEIERSDRTRVYRKEYLYEPYTYENQTLMVRKGIGFGDDKTTLGEVRSYDIAPDPVRTCIDVGANVGAFTVWLESLWPAVQIVAEEPELSSYMCLHENTRDLPNVYAGNSAVLYSHDPVVLYVNPNNSGCHQVLIGRDFNHELSTVPLDETITLEQIMKDFSWTTLDLLKLDCEGSEVDILMNCTEEFLHSVKRIVGEFHAGPDNFRTGIGQRLIDLGFDVVWQTDPKAHATFVAINKNWVEPESLIEPVVTKKKAGRPKKS